MLSALLIWAIVAGTLLPFLPGPAAVARALVRAAQTQEFYASFSITLRRILIGFTAAYVTALVLGIWMARNWIIEAAIHPWVFIGLALPGPVTVFFAILVFGLGGFTTFFALWAAVTPFIVTYVYDSTLALDRQLAEMGRVYHLSGLQQLRHIVLPQLAPAFLAGARFGFALSWKLIVLVEALSATRGVGERLSYFFAFNDPASVVAWTLSFTVIMIIVELAVFRTLARRLFAWQTTTPSGEMADLRSAV